MADADLVSRAGPLKLQARLAAWLPWALLAFVASAFILPTGPAYAIVFYAAVVVPALAAAPRYADWRAPGPLLATLLIVWSGLTLFWGHDDGGRSAKFAIDSVMTMIFLLALLAGLSTAAQRRRLMTVLIWSGAANAILSLALEALFPHRSERLHGWGATSHPILGASVMSVAYLAALCRTLTERRLRGAHLAAAAIMALFVLYTESRGPLLAVTVATVFLCAAGPWRVRALGTLAGLAALWRLLPASVREHHAAVLVARGASHRFEIWHRSLQMIGEHPLFGNGLAANLDLKGFTFPHDLYLSVLFYSGAVGFLLFAALVLWVSRAIWRAKPEPERLWVAAIWVSMLLSGLTDLGQITKGPGPMWFIFWVPVGVALSQQSFFEKNDQKTSASSHLDR